MVQSTAAAPKRRGQAKKAPQAAVWEPAIKLPPPDLTPVPADRFAAAQSLRRLTPAEQQTYRAGCYWLQPPVLLKHPKPPEHMKVRRPSSGFSPKPYSNVGPLALLATLRSKGHSQS